MQTATRTFFGLALLVLVAGVIFSLAPVSGQAAPFDLNFTLQRIKDAVLSPGVLGLLALGLGLLIFDKFLRRPEAVKPPRVESFLEPLPSGVNSTEASRLALAELKASLEGLNPFNAIECVELISHAAVRSQASDIHIQPLGDATQISLRVHGSLQTVTQLPIFQHASIIQRLKVLTRVVAYVTDRPQDGHFSISTPDGKAEMRTSFLPTQHGEKVVMRVARAGMSLPELSSLGLPQKTENQLKNLLAKPQGLLFFTGPTGSGKTTSIYASLGHLLTERGNLVNIATIEDPIEFNVPQLSQTQVNSAAKLNFAEGLRALLRQDPNVLMVGEIRDVETARIAAQAGLTGHLILTTVHANSSAGVFTRLLEMQIEPFVVASVSIGCISQRLVRKLCTHCRQEQAPTAEQREQIKHFAPSDAQFYVSTGCTNCSNEGFVGRAAVYEVLVVTPKIRELIPKRVSSDELMQVAISEGTLPMVQAAVRCANAGVTTLAEALRVAG